jgi:hypothetical protein
MPISFNDTDFTELDFWSSATLRVNRNLDEKQ